MTIQRTTPASHADWLKLRAPYIGASEIAALFGCHAQQTLLGLYAKKTGVAMAEPDDAILERGHILEPAVAEYVRRQRPTWKLQKNEDYFHSDEWGLGATPDYWVHCPERGIGVLQCKAVAMPQYKEKWQDGAPMGYILQTAQEALLADVAWGVIGVLAVGSYDYDGGIYEFERKAGAEMRITAAASKFWCDVRAGRQPAADYARDEDVIKALYPRDNGTTVDLSGDNRLAYLLAERKRLMDEIATASPASKTLDAINAEIKAKVGDASLALLPGWEISYKLQKRKATPESEFRVLRVKEVRVREMAA